MSQSPFYLEHYLDSLETLPGELRRNFTKMTDKDVMNKDIMVQIDGASDEYLRKVRDLSPTKRKAEMEKIQVGVSVKSFLVSLFGCCPEVDHTAAGDWTVKGAPRRERGSPATPTHHPPTKCQYLTTELTSQFRLSPFFLRVSILQSSAAMPPLFLPAALC